MRCRWYVALAVLAACGRLGFGDRSTRDGASGDAPGSDAPRTLTAAYLKASNTDTYDQFGIAVALSGDGSTLAVGAYDECSGAAGIAGDQSDNTCTHSGAVYVFVRAGTSWVQQAYVKASNPDAGDEFGHALALSYDGSTLAAGAYLEDSGATGVGGIESDNTASDAGAVYVFARAGTTWSQQAYVKASNTHPGDQFGWALAVSGDGNTLAVGAPLEDSSGTDSGATYVYTRSAGTWTWRTYLKASNADAGDNFGSAVALDFAGTTLAIGAETEDGGATGVNGNEADNSQPDAGAVYVLAGAGDAWSQQAYVKGSTAITGDFFGQGLAVDGDTLAVGAPGDDTNASNGGALYMFVRTGAAWSEQAKLYAPNAGANDQFATTVALAGDRAIAGAAMQNSGTGEAYVFARAAATWNAGTIVDAPNPGIGDAFGVTVSLAANGSYAVGAFREDSSTTGIDSTPDDNAMDAGATYVWSY